VSGRPYATQVSEQPSRPELLLASPLGRELLTGYIGWGPESFDTALRDRLGLGPVPGRVPLSRPGRRPRRWQDVESSLLIDYVGLAVGWRSWREQLADADEAALLGALSGVTDSFGFSQGQEDLWGLTAQVRPQLLPVAQALLAAPGARNWWDPARLDGQRLVEWDGEPALLGPALEQAVRDVMRDERARNELGRAAPRRRERPDARIGAWWWSTPRFARQSSTSRPVGSLPALSLCQFFDDSVQAEGATVWSVEVDPAARVLEITEPADWQQLVAGFPRDVTGTHDGDWRYWSGTAGPWLLPDWEQVMEHADAVHVTTGAVACAGGVALPVDGAYTMLHAWVPDSTLWLRDMTVSRRRLGRWEGGPQYGSWDGPPPEWHPESTSAG
jgi:hypothetical protein